MRKLVALALVWSLGGCYFVGKKRGAPTDPRAPVTLPHENKPF
jgi:hypothetical protein